MESSDDIHRHHGFLSRESLAALGGRIARQRARKGWSQRELARRTAIDSSRLSRIENGRCLLRLDELVSLSVALGTNLDELVFGRAPDASPGPFEDLSAKELKRLRQLMAWLSRLQGAFRFFAAELPPAPEEAVREIVRARIERVVNDYLPEALRSVEAALAEADPEAVP